MAIYIQLPRMIAHRGASAEAPENTLAALRRAHAIGVGWVECDLQLTRDGQVVVCHDKSVDRTTNGQGLVRNYTLAKLKKLDAGAWFGPQFKGESIPTLFEWLDCAKQLGLSLNLELKASGRRNAALVKAVHALLSSSDYQDMSVLISSFSVQCLRLLYRLNSQIPLGYVASHWPFGYWRLLKRYVPSICSIHLDKDCLSEKRVASLHACGYKVRSFTIDDVVTARRLLAMGVDGLFCNHCLQLSKQLNHE